MTDAAPVRRTALAIAAALGIAYAYFYQGGGWNQNTRFALVRSILEQQTLRIDDTARDRGKPITGDIARRDGHLYSDKAPGASFTALPAVLVAGAFVREPSSRNGIAVLSWVATLAAAALPTVLAALVLFHLSMGFGFGTAAAAFAALSFGLATPAWALATLLFGHALAAYCLVAAYAAAIALQRDEGTARDVRLALAVGLSAGWATVTEYPCAIPAAILAVLAVASGWEQGNPRRLRIAAGVGAGALVGVVVLALHNNAAFGSPFALGYSHEAGDFGGMKQGFMGITTPKLDVLGKILFGAYRGLFYHSPVLALAPVGLGLLAASRTTRRPAIAAIAIVAYFLLLNSAYFYWDGGACIGPRHVSPALPFLGIGLAALWNRAARWGKAVLLAFAAGSAFVMLVAVATTPQSPEWFVAPWSQLNWVAFRQGRVAINQQAYVEIQPTNPHDPIAHSWNLGQQLGLRGLASLMPLGGVWIAILLAWAIAGKPAGAVPEAGAPEVAPQASRSTGKRRKSRRGLPARQ